MTRFNSIVALAGLASFAALPLRADIIAATSDQLKFIPEGNLAAANLELSIPGLRAVAVGDVFPASPGEEIILARGIPSVLEVRSTDGTTVLAAADFGADSDPIGHPGGGPTYSGPETINDLAVGDCRPDLPGLEIGLASQAVLGDNTTGLIRVLYIADGVLSVANGMGTYLDCSAVAIDDVNSRASGTELVFCFQYQPDGNTYDTQVATYRMTDAGFVEGAIRNVAGYIPAGGLTIGDATGDGGNPEILIGTDLGLMHLYQASTLDPDNALILSFAHNTDPISARGDLTDISAVALGDVDPATAGDEIVCSTRETEETLRTIDSNSEALMTELSNVASPAADVFAMVAYDGLGDTAADEVFVAAQDAGGSLVLLNGGLAEIQRQAGLGTWSDLAFTPPVIPNAVLPVEWLMY